ncbi:hypothetical protein [Corynebacterium terpenotabidum]|uniref:Uncharacterized protein n=1 Tax=Corynebacterium terpenotabidum Y-11 TaxID=1200352 RepID=S4XAE8_9CORY|nr:hypothetical protein [Corynebacterium terpenotabidum]AGP30117.1 hypothetical protein A606_02320 [Corynebacterium terpenotabidum Y-11]
MDQIPWGWQVAISFAVPIISALGAYGVAWMTAHKADLRREKDQTAEEARRQEEREDQKESQKREDRLDSLHRQRDAVVNFSAAVRNARDECWSRRNEIGLEKRKYEDDDDIELLSADYILQFYRTTRREIAVLELIIQEGETRRELETFKDIITHRYDGVNTILHDASADRDQRVNYLNNTPVLPPEDEDLLAKVEAAASEELRERPPAIDDPTPSK